jgi:hypothetical protein
MGVPILRPINESLPKSNTPNIPSNGNLAKQPPEPTKPSALDRLYNSRPLKQGSGISKALQGWGITRGNPKPTNSNIEPPKTKTSGLFGSWGPTSAIEGKKKTKLQPRTRPELEKALWHEKTLTNAERKKIIGVAKENAGYTFKDWEAKKMATKLLADNQFSDPDRKAIKKILITKK